jgi:hypothetical protein
MVAQELSRALHLPFVDGLLSRETPPQKMLSTFKRLPNIFTQYQVTFDNEFRISEWTRQMHDTLVDLGTRRDFVHVLRVHSLPAESARLFATLHIYGTGLQRASWLPDTVRDTLEAYQEDTPIGYKTMFGPLMLDYLRRDDEVNMGARGAVYMQIKNDMIQCINRFYDSLESTHSGTSLSHT